MTDFFPPDIAILTQLKSIVGDGGWRDAVDAERYFEDPRGRFKGKARLVLMPASTKEVSRIVRLCNEYRTGLIPYGGGTGVVAGQLSPKNENAIILSVERLNRIREVKTGDFAMVAEAGCILENVHAVAAEHGLIFPLSMASKGSCTIGGNLATNAGGIQVLRYGNARDLCLGIEAVLPSGDILSELNPLRKNNTGYDLRHLLIGSEGTLGIITAATLVLKPQEPETVTALCAIATPAQALKVFEAFRKELGESLSGLELLSDFGLRLVNRHFPALKNPLAEPDDWYLLAEISGQDGTRERVECTCGMPGSRSARRRRRRVLGGTAGQALGVAREHARGQPSVRCDLQQRYRRADQPDRPFRHRDCGGGEGGPLGSPDQQLRSHR